MSSGFTTTETLSGAKHRQKHPPSGATTRETRVTTEKAKVLGRVRRVLARATAEKTKAMKAMTTERPITLPAAPWEQPKFKSVRKK
jgi:hypothetical protein